MKASQFSLNNFVRWKMSFRKKFIKKTRNSSKKFKSTKNASSLPLTPSTSAIVSTTSRKVWSPSPSPRMFWRIKIWISILCFWIYIKGPFLSWASLRVWNRSAEKSSLTIWSNFIMWFLMKPWPFSRRSISVHSLKTLSLTTTRPTEKVSGRFLPKTLKSILNTLESLSPWTEKKMESLKNF